MEAIRQVAHALKGGSSAIGAARFAARCNDVQENAQRTDREGTFAGANLLLAEASQLPDLLTTVANYN